jgi:hypothetical protein
MRPIPFESIIVSAMLEQQKEINVLRAECARLREERQAR